MFLSTFFPHSLRSRSSFVRSRVRQPIFLACSLAIRSSIATERARPPARLAICPSVVFCRLFPLFLQPARHFLSLCRPAARPPATWRSDAKLRHILSLSLSLCFLPALPFPSLAAPTNQLQLAAPHTDGRGPTRTDADGRTDGPFALASLYLLSYESDNIKHLTKRCLPGN